MHVGEDLNVVSFFLCGCFHGGAGGEGEGGGAATTARGEQGGRRPASTTGGGGDAGALCLCIALLCHCVLGAGFPLFSMK
jgi:hypothetical protein